MKTIKIFGLIVHLFFIFVPIILVATKESQAASLNKSQSASVSRNKSQPASPNKRTTIDVIQNILQNKEIFPPPHLSVGHFDGDDADKLQDKAGNNYTDKIATLLMSDPTRSLSQREARLIIGALDRKTCFAKVLCGLGNQEPDKHTDLLNDYAYLMGEVLGTSQEEQDDSPSKKNNKKKTKKKKPHQESILTDIWDEFSIAKENLENDDDDKSDQSEDDAQQDDDATSGDRFDLDEYRVLHGKVDHFPVPHHHHHPHHVMNLPPFRPRPLPRRRIKIIRPKLYLGRVRIGRKLAARQCRQLGDGDKNNQKYQCPYDDAQMGTIVTKLRQTMRGEGGGSVLNTVGQGALSGASQAMQLLRGAANTLKSSVSSSPEKMNVVINLHQNMSMPGGNPQMPDFAGFYGSSSHIAVSNQSQLIQAHSGEEGGHLGGRVGGVLNFNPFYIIPLGNSPANQAPPPPPPAPLITTTPPTPTITTTTPEPLQQLIGFLYSVGYANESTPPPETVDRPLTLADLAMLTKSSKKTTQQNDDDDYNDETAESEEVVSSNRNKDKAIYADKEGIVRIKFSRRSGRFQREEEDQSTRIKQDRSSHDEPQEQQLDNVNVPTLFLRTVMRFVSYMGARVG